MSHDFHDALEGYNPDQILHDGCSECEYRGESVERAVANMDAATFARAWQRAYDFYATHGDGAARETASRAELPVLKALWAVQVQLERRGHRLTGRPPDAWDRM